VKVEFRAFAIVGIFLLIVAGAYTYMTAFDELAGSIALFMAFLLCIMVAGYLFLHSRANPPRPEDRKDGEIAEGAGEVGFFPPHSYWPLYLAATMAVLVLAPVLGWWLGFIAVAFGAITLTGWVYEFYRGRHAH